MKAYSKINLILKIYPKTKDESKHKIDSLFLIHKKIYDIVKIKPSFKNSINFYDEKGGIIQIENNILNLLNYLNKSFNLNQKYEIKIIKNIPIGSGLGGSSTDQARIIAYFCKHNHIPLNKLDWKFIALKFGSDIPFFLSNYRCARVLEYGEKVQKIKIKRLKIKLLINSIKCSSKHVFKKLDENKKYHSEVNFDACLSSLNGDNLSLKKLVFNDLTKYAFICYQDLYKIYSKQNNAKLCIMSGSGSTIIKIL